MVLVLVLMSVLALVLVLEVLALGKQSSSWWKEEPGVAGLSHLSSVTLWSPASFVSPSPPVPPPPAPLNPEIQSQTPSNLR